MTIAAVTCIRDEADIIEEWLAHHLALGIQRIHIFDNGSEDGTRARVEAIARQEPGVTIQDWRPASGEPQQAAFAAGLELMRAEDVEWCAFMDADEFIGNGRRDAAGAAERFADFLARHEAHAAIGMNWAIYGSSGHQTRPPGLIQENFLRRAPDDFSVHRHIKSIVRPRFTMGVHHVHGFSLEAPYVNAAGEEIVWRTQEHGGAVPPFAYTETAPCLDEWRINHYFCRWRGRWEEKMRLSRLRAVFWRSEQDWVHHDRNEVFDDTPLRLTPATRARMEAWGVEVAPATVRLSA